MSSRAKCAAILLLVGVGMSVEAAPSCDGRVQRAAFAELVDAGASCWMNISRFGPDMWYSDACQHAMDASERAEEESVRLKGCKYIPYGATPEQVRYVSWLADELRRFRLGKWDSEKGWVKK